MYVRHWYIKSIISTHRLMTLNRPPYESLMYENDNTKHEGISCLVNDAKNKTITLVHDMEKNGAISLFSMHVPSKQMNQKPKCEEKSFIEKNQRMYFLIKFVENTETFSRFYKMKKAACIWLHENQISSRIFYHDQIENFESLFATLQLIRKLYFNYKKGSLYKAVGDTDEKWRKPT